MLNLRSKSTARDIAIEALLDSPLAREAEARAAQEIADRRIALVKRLAKMERDSERAFHADRAAQAKAKAAVADAVKTLTAARAALAALETQRASDVWAWNTEVAEIEQELRGTADPAIGAAIEELRDQLDAAFKIRIVDDSAFSRNPVTGAVERKPGRRLVQPVDRVKAIREAIAACEALRLAANQADIPANLAAIRASIPTVGAVMGGGAND